MTRCLRFLSRQRGMIAGGAGLFLAALAALGWAALGRGTEVTDREVLGRIQAVAASGDAPRALSFSVYAYPFDATPELQREWAEFELELAAQLRQLNRIAYWAQRSPGLLEEDEAASLNWVRALMHEGRSARALEVIEPWLAQGERTALWFLTKADVLILAGQHEAAVALLQSRTFSGRDEAFRLIRLAILQTGQPDAVNVLMTKALQAAPDLADLRAFLGELYEKRRDFALAEREFVRAYRYEPANPVWQNLLVDFYVRRGQYHPAVRLINALEPSELTAELWLKRAFMTRLVTGETSSHATFRPSAARLPAVAMLQAHAEGNFWPSRDAAPQAWAGHVMRRPEAVWLGFFSLLEAGEEGEAARFLTQHEAEMKRFSWLGHEAFAALLSLRAPEAIVRQRFDLPDSPMAHPVFAALRHALTARSEVGADAFAQNPQAFAALALGLGWLEAGLALSAAAPPPAWAWWDYSYAQALRYNRSAADALDFLENRATLSRAGACLRGELLLGAGKGAAAEIVFARLQAEQDGAAYRAAWLHAIAQLEQNDRTQVRRIIEDYAVLDGSPLQRDLRLLLGESAVASEGGAPASAGVIEMAVRLRQALRQNQPQVARDAAFALQEQFPHSPRVQRLVSEVTDGLAANQNGGPW